MELVHRLVALAFLSNSDPIQFTQINHKDCARDNNLVENLEWCTPLYNTHYNNACAKYSKPIMQLSLSGLILRHFPSIREAGRSTQINFANIGSCVKGRKKSAGGYRWAYAS
jgi:hypothetical protein